MPRRTAALSESAAFSLPWLALAVLLSSCSADRAMYTPYLATDSMGTVVRARLIPTRLRRDLVEASAAVMSGSRQGVFFALNDSGHDPFVFAVDTAGVNRGAWRVTGASNGDWEAASLGPCGAPGEPGRIAKGTRCLYIGDVGDNPAERTSVTVYRLPEPRVRTAGMTGEIAAESLSFRYEGGAQDVEAMYVAPDGTMFFINKRPLRDSAGRLRPAQVFRLPPSAWGSSGGATVAMRADSLPIVIGSARGRQITDASLAPDGAHLAVRTYVQLYVFATDPGTGRVRKGVRPSVCNLVDLREKQGEGVTWMNGGRLLLVSEGQKEPLRIVECPPPR